MNSGSIRPSRAQFRRLAREHEIVPVVKEILGDLETPVSAFRKLAENAPDSFLLESVEGGENWGRYSILGARATGRFVARGNEVEIRWRGRTRRSRAKDPLDALARWLGRFRSAPVADLPRFFGGAVGHLSYDLVRGMERLPDSNRASEDTPDLDLLLVTELVVFDNLSHRIQLVCCAEPGKDPDRSYAEARESLEALEEMLRGADPKPLRWTRGTGPRLRSSTSRREFHRAVRAAREYIAAGDCFQIVLSHELSTPLRAPALDVYRALRVLNPSPYMFYLDYGEREIVGASPEVLVRVEGGRAEVRPIAGTRARGADAAADRRQIEDLLNDEKEVAEHIMLVDLGRNDLGRVCRYGSVSTDELMVIEKYSHVIHMVSHVSGVLEEGKDAFDALRACYPAGTVSGAPKIRAMEIIDELENRRRGVYAGAVGYFSFDGAMDTCIAIRTMEARDGHARLGAGAGIVLDSRPEREWDETHEKAGALRRAIEMAEEGLDA